LFVLDDTTDRWQVAGLSSWGINPLLPEEFSRSDSRYGDLAFFTDLTQHREWIATQIPEPGGLGCLVFALLILRRRPLPRSRTD
jgi:hypothetical protein